MKTSSSPSYITKQIGCAGILLTGMVAAADSRIVGHMFFVTEMILLVFVLTCMNLGITIKIFLSYN